MLKMDEICLFYRYFKYPIQCLNLRVYFGLARNKFTIFKWKNTIANNQLGLSHYKTVCKNETKIDITMSLPNVSRAFNRKAKLDRETRKDKEDGEGRRKKVTFW